ncbi:MAG TPA: hypothetical protein VMS98_12140, partial [Thermoanaerobaculia bacterium]|nr:hypothetical protein [Thermoanaerobaculia bacterium]
TLTGILNDEPATLEDSFPEPFIWVVDRCLAKDPAQRYGSTSDLAHDLANLRSRPETGTRRVASSYPQKWMLPAALAILAAAIGFALLWPRNPRERLMPVRASVVIPELTSIDFGEVGMPLDISPDGRYLVISGSSVDQPRGLWLHDLRTGTTRLLSAEGRLPAFSPDSKSVAYFAEGKLKTMSVEGGPPRTICAARPEGIPSWRGDTILFVQYSIAPGIYRVSARGGSPQLVVPAERSAERLMAPWWPHFLPGGDRFLYLTLEAEADGVFFHRLFVHSLESGSSLFIATLDSRAVYASGHLLFVRDGTLLAQPFDPESGRLTGEPATLAGDIAYFKNTGLASFGVSDDGTLVWRAARRQAMLSWVNRNGDVLSTIGVAPFVPDGRLSPDGRRYAVGIIDPKDGASDIWVYDLERESPERLTFGPADEKSPVWAPDGASVFHRSDGFRNPPDVVRRQLGADRSTMVYRGPGVEEPHDVSADGKWLLFIDYFTTGADINVMPLDPPGPPRPFVATPFNETSPRFSPDGRWVAYTSDVSGMPEIYIRPFVGAGESTRVSKEGGTHPRWRRDGKELLFLAPRGRVMAVSFANGVFGAPQLLFQAVDAVHFEPAADGSRFLVQFEQRSNAGSINLLINWPSQLKASP